MADGEAEAPLEHVRGGSGESACRKRAGLQVAHAEEIEEDGGLGLVALGRQKGKTKNGWGFRD
jgi:hypothetical protein